MCCLLRTRRISMHSKRLAMALALVPALMSTGCDWLFGKELKPEFCATHPTDSDCVAYCADHPSDPNCDLDAPKGCASSAECSAPTAVCDVAGTKTCVECVAPDETAACTGAEPVCGDDHTCRRCVAHAECASAACLSDGTCALETSVAYVDPNGTDNSMCTLAMPCTEVAKALATSRPFVKFKGTTDEAVTLNGEDVTFLAEPGARLTRTSPGIVLRVDGGTKLSVHGLEIADGLGATGTGIALIAGNTATVSLTGVKLVNNAGGGITTSGGTLTVSRSKISGNAGGGISISASSFDITNSFITQNGGPASLVGGINFATVAGAGTRRLDFNTISANAGTATVNSGVNCGTVGSPITFSNNIIFANVVSGGGKQLGGSANCTATFSDIGPDPTSGTGNINADPLFVNVVQGNFHIQPASPAKNAADPAATLSVDFDGDVRPQGGRSDIGADEAP
ncbi:MAG: DUF5123 domain-containing protein [Deltaproteobacteria bacterium]|nr:DUF5123 domain-containing protein [Deltaproteobacteria bacterium]